MIQEKAYVGGKGTDNAGGYIVDYLAKVKATDSVIFIEIKHLRPRYRADNIEPEFILCPLTYRGRLR